MCLTDYYFLTVLNDKQTQTTGQDYAGKGSCSVDSDCRKPGQKCHNIMDAGCECKGGSHFNHSHKVIKTSHFNH